MILRTSTPPHILIWEKTFDKFDKIIGIDRIGAFHVNDSKKELGSRVDRHDHIGCGVIGLEAFRLLVNDPRFKDVPFSLVTPKVDDLTEDVENMRILKAIVGKKRVPKNLKNKNREKSK